MVREDLPRRLAQSPPNPVADDSLADLFGDGVADPDAVEAVGRLSADQQQRRRARLLARLRDKEIRPLFDRFNRLRGGHWPASRFFHGPLGRKLLAAPGTAARDHFAAVLGRQTRAKAVTALADKLARLIGPFHGRLSFVDSRSCGTGAPGEGPPGGRAIRRGAPSRQARRRLRERRKFADL